MPIQPQAAYDHDVIAPLLQVLGADGRLRRIAMSMARVAHGRPTQTQLNALSCAARRLGRSAGTSESAA